jgi:hypothetical protein
MHRVLAAFALGFACGTALAADLGNALIDYDAFAINVQEVRALRQARRISEADFIRMAAEPETWCSMRAASGFSGYAT